MAIQAKVEAIEGSMVSIVLKDGQKLNIPIDECEAPPSVGSELRVFIIPMNASETGSANIAKDVLKEILG